GLYRMKQFFETYSPQQIANSHTSGTDLAIVSAVRTQLGTKAKKPKVSAVRTQINIDSLSSIKDTMLVQISWTNHRLILSKTTSREEQIFYLLLTIKEAYSSRELERQIDSGYYERVMLSKRKNSPALTRLRKDISLVFKDTYVFEFLNLPGTHSENDLKKGLVQNIKKLLLELGKDFSFISEEYKIKVGSKDFFIDLLFYHRELCCLVAFELKIDDFKPEYLGKINFYLEALDREVKKKHENPSVGVLLCKQKDDEVVEYALSRSLSPTMISKYKTKLINKTLLKKKLHELFQMEDARNKNNLL
ncbi:MAG: PDDEXK nuclease domain-containing protein, partial [Bacteroidota bacterium]|nr:PDDEXK nuclease domain-containing protein [Bacteroidota bacterium]